VLAYRELQLEATITQVDSANQVRLSATPVVSETGVQAVFGTDNAAAITAGVTLAKALKLRIARLPPGVICVYDNMVWTGLSDIVISGAGKYGTKMRDLRRASREDIYTAQDKGIFSLIDPVRVTFQDFAINGSVPVMGFAHSGGGSPTNNESGGRNGFFFDDAIDCEVVRIRSDDIGTRDEFIIWQGDSPGFKMRDCDGVTNNISVNVNTSNQCERGAISGCDFTSGYSAFLCGSDNAVASGCTWSGPEGYSVGADLFVVDASARMQCSGHTVRRHNSPDASVSAVHLFTGNTDPGNIQLSSFIIDSCVGLYANGCLAIARDGVMSGVVKASNISFTRIESTTPGSSFVYVNAGNAESVTFDQITMSAAEDSLMAFGVVVDEDVPDGVVTTSNLTFGPSIRNSANYVISGAEASFYRLGWWAAFEADHYESAGGVNVDRFCDRVDISHILTPTGTIAVPTADAALGGKLSAHFTGTQYLTSNKPASYWNFLHGQTCFALHVFVPTEVTDGTIYMIASTGAHNTTERAANHAWVGNDNWYALVGNGSTNVSTTIPTPSPVPVVGTALMFAVHRTTLSTQIRQGAAMGTVGSSVADTAAISDLAPVSTLRIGAASAGVNPAKMRWGGSYFRGDTTMGVSELAKVAAYLAWRWA
jgi:hypothetical protein